MPGHSIDRLFRNVRLLTMREPATIDAGAIACSAGRITYAGIAGSMRNAADLRLDSGPRMTSLG
jgi:hypothetical protein